MSERPLERRGFSLAELMVVVVLLGIVGGAILNVIVKQQRFYRATDEVIGVRTRLRDATAILPVDLRSLGPQPDAVTGFSGDILAVSNSSIAFRSTFGTSIACAVAGTTIHLPPLGRLASGATYTAFQTTPAVGDEVAIFNAAANTWTLTTLTAAPSASGGVCTAGAGAGFFRRATDPDGLQVTVASVGSGIQVGSPIRFLKRVKYGLYKAGDGRWYLGFAFITGDGSTWSPQPVSGPYTENGLTIACRDTVDANVPVASCANNGKVGRLDFIFRSETNAAVTRSGVGTQAKYLDSMTVRVALRNNS